MERASQQSQIKRKNPSFFQQIPSPFIKVFGKDVPKKAILETYYGKSEEVEVGKHENRFCFCKGWSKFVEDNKLETGDFLVFKYVSDCSKFKVKIYGRTCCEKEYCHSSDVSGKKSSEPGKNEEDERNDDDDARKRKREEERDGELKAAKRIDSSSDSDIGDEAYEDETINLVSESCCPIVEEEQEEEVGNSKEATSEEKGNGEGKGLQTDGDQIGFESQNPSFQVKLKSSSINNYLNIPLSFWREYIKREMEIKIETGKNKRMWEVGLRVLWGVGKKKEVAGTRLTQGWKNLVTEYELQMGDVCIFELIQPTTTALLFRLRVRRWHPQNNTFIHIL